MTTTISTVYHSYQSTSYEMEYEHNFANLMADDYRTLIDLLHHKNEMNLFKWSKMVTTVKRALTTGSKFDL